MRHESDSGPFGGWSASGCCGGAAVVDADQDADSVAGVGGGLFGGELDAGGFDVDQRELLELVTSPAGPVDEPDPVTGLVRGVPTEQLEPAAAAAGLPVEVFQKGSVVEPCL